MPEPTDPIDLPNAPPPAPRRKPVGKWRRRARRTIGVLCWLYVLVLVAVWLVVRFEGDRWWIATLLLYGPRWLWSLPLLPLLPLALFGRRRSLGALLLAALLVAFPIMNLRLPWRRLTAAPPAGPTLRLLTLNTHEGMLNAQGLRQLIAAAGPQVVVLQELDPRLARTIFADGPWYIAMEEQLVVASRYPVRLAGPVGTRKSSSFYAAARFEVDTPAGVVPVVSVHLTSPHVAFHNTLHLDPRGSGQIEQNSVVRLREAADVARAATDAGPAVLLAGDFNMPTDSLAYRSNLASLGNAFDAGGLGFGWTYDVRLTVTRIDHILTGGGWNCRRSWVGGDLGSPHRPLIADLEWTGGTLPQATPPPVSEVIPVAVPAPAPPPMPAPAPPTPPPPPMAILTTPQPDPIADAIRRHQLAVGMTLEQATQALAGWEGPVELRAKLDDGSKLFRWRKGDERIGVAFDATGRLRSFQKL